MGYTTYEFYTDKYYGDTVPESSFEKWQQSASDKLNYLCFGHITLDDVEQYDTEIQKAVCALADVLFKLDEAKLLANNPEKGNIKSMTVGDQSVSFGSNDTEYTLAMSDTKKQYDLMVDAVSVYLSHTGLLYAGCD